MRFDEEPILKIFKINTSCELIFIHISQQQNILSIEQRVNDFNPPYT